MKKEILITIICGMMVTGSAFSQHTTSMSLIPGGTIFQQNDTFTVEMFLSYSGYSSYGFSTWLETLAGTQSFFHITSEEHFPPFPIGYTGPNEFIFPMTNGVDQGYYATSNDMGGGNNPLMLVPPGTYDVERVHFSITNAALGTYTFYSTSTNPRPSIVTDDQFNDNAIPRASFSITIVPEPSTCALLAVVGTGLGLIAYRRLSATR